MDSLGGFFWNNVDAFRTVSLKELCAKSDMNYKTLRSQRSRKSLPSLSDAKELSCAMDVPIDTLLTGRCTQELPEKISEITKRLLAADDSDIEMIKRILEI